MKLERKQVVDILNVLNNMGKEKLSPRIALGIARNKAVAEEELKLIQEARSKVVMPEGLLKYDEERIELCKQYAEKDEEGNPKEQEVKNPDTGQKQSIFVFSPENNKELTKAIEKLIENKYKDAFEEKDAIEEEFEDLLNEEIDVSMVKLDIDKLPDLTTEQVKVIEPILEVD